MFIYHPILSRFRTALDALYGSRINHAVLFGSRARGDARTDSDYDIAVVLTHLDGFGLEAERLAVTVSQDSYLSSTKGLKGMAKQETLTVRLHIIYDGTPPNVWDGGAKDFGVQDKDDVLHLGRTERSGKIVFELVIDVRPDRTTTPVFFGDFAHGPTKERFLYLSWRNTNGAYAQRLKLPLGGITWRDIDSARIKPLIGEVAASKKPRVPGNTNVGGTRAVAWKPTTGEVPSNPASPDHDP